jgi:hypothetical protein
MTVGPIIGVIIGMAVVTAFFLEAGFIGIMLYGEGRVSERVTMFANVMVALDTLLSTTWILAANSWMQTPAGFLRVHGRFQPKDWWNVIFNPSFPHRFFHMLAAVLVAATWLIAGISAFYLRPHSLRLDDGSCCSHEVGTLRSAHRSRGALLRLRPRSGDRHRLGLYLGRNSGTPLGRCSMYTAWVCSSRTPEVRRCSRFVVRDRPELPLKEISPLNSSRSTTVRA